MSATDIGETSTNNAMNRIIQQISNGTLGIPYANRPTTAGVVPSGGQYVAAAGSPYFQTPQGTYGRKPLY
jgi:hypothetical protein